jgi:hypothetical protein
MGRVYAYVVNYSTRFVDLVCRWCRSSFCMFSRSPASFRCCSRFFFLTAGLSRGLLYKSYRRHTNVADRIQHRLACYQCIFVDVCCCYSGSLGVLVVRMLQRSEKGVERKGEAQKRSYDLMCVIYRCARALKKMMRHN